MIGLILNWSGIAVDPDRRRRLIGGLASGTGLTVTESASDGGLFAVRLDGTKRAAPVAVARTPRGESTLFHGVLHNRDALRRNLGLTLTSDAALYAAGYAAWGDDIDHRAIGEYASVIATPEQRSARFARSPIQAPPLHFYRDSNLIVVASSANAIFATGALTPEIDEQKIVDSLYLNYCEAERDWFRNLWRLPVGARAIETPVRRTVVRFHDLGRLPQVRLSRDADYVEAASALLDDGVRACMQDRQRPALCLSGGFDSQAVAVHTLPQLAPGARLRAMTAVPEAGWDGIADHDGIGDERTHARALADMYPQIDLGLVDAAGLSFDHRLDAILAFVGGPPRNAMNLHWMHAIMAEARAEGCDVVLTGTLGNYSFGFDGTGAFPAMFARGRWRRLLRELAAQSTGGSITRRVFSQAIKPHLSARLGRWGRRPLPDWCPLDGSSFHAIGASERARGLVASPGGRSPVSTREWRTQAIMAASAEGGAITQAFELIHGVALRDPTAYRPLVEFCLGIPDDQFVRSGETRWLARRMLSGKIPETVLGERRQGVQCADWHLRLGRDIAALRHEFDRAAADPDLAKIFDIARFTTALNDWPTETPLGPQREALQLALPRILTTARFIRRVQGSNG